MTTATTMERALSKAIKARKSALPQTMLEREFGDGPGVKLVKISVADAYDLLTGDRNPDNRPLSQSKIDQFARDIRNDHWRLNGSTIVISREGLLNDGQHRLEAVIQADAPILSLVVFGVERDSRFTVDQGRPRNAGCYLAMEGINNAATIAAMARLAISYEESRGASVKTQHGPTNADVREFVHQHRAELEAAIEPTNKQRKAFAGITSQTLLAFWGYLLRHHGPVAREYLWKIQTGEQISIGDTAYRVRERLAVMTRTSRHAQTEVVLRGWAFYRDGKQWRQIKLTGELPKIGKGPDNEDRTD